EGELQQQVRNSKVRARLRVPTTGNVWEKAKRAWFAPGEHGQFLAERLTSLPGRITLSPLDAASRALLLACGARAEFDVGALLEVTPHELDVRLALCAYLLEQLESGRRESWKLEERRWVPDGNGEARYASELLWCDPLALELGDPALLVHPDLPEPEGNARRLAGVRDFKTLRAEELAPMLEGRILGDALLSHFEERLSRPSERVGVALTGSLIEDDAGRPRRVAQLALSGAPELFGDWGGNASALRTRPSLARALGVPSSPTAHMVGTFLREAFEDGADIQAVSRCYTWLDGQPKAPKLSEHMAVPMHGAALARVGDSKVRFPWPPEVAAHTTYGCIAPALKAHGVVHRALLTLGTRDLWSDFTLVDATFGAAVKPSAELEALAARVKLPVRHVQDIAGAGHLPQAASKGNYRGSVGALVTSIDALIHEDALWVTPRACLGAVAAALEPEPEARAAAWRALERGENPTLEAAGPRQRKAPSEPAPSFGSRLKRFFGWSDSK
ncbi:MAG: hypothetical protein AAF411_32270, partial [Myxococcota bacterium]